MNETHKDVVITFPPEKSHEGNAGIRKVQTRSGEVLRLRVSDTTARAKRIGAADIHSLIVERN